MGHSPRDGVCHRDFGAPRGRRGADITTWHNKVPARALRSSDSGAP